MEVKCAFTNIGWTGIGEQYSCWIESQEIPEGTELVFKGKHEYNKMNADVTGIWFSNCSITKVPQNLAKTFPNLKALLIYKSKLKNITKADLTGYKQLRYVKFDYNQLEFLPGDLFEGFEKLELISFYDNMLDIIEPNILDGFKPGQLKCVDFSRNPNYDKCYSTVGYEPNATLEEVKKELKKIH